MQRHPAELEIHLALEGDASAEELDAHTGNLREELLELDVDAVERVRGESPSGARAIEAAEIGGLVVTAAPTVLSSVVEAIRSWLTRDRGRAAKLTIGEDSIELSDASAEEQEQLVTAFLARHARG